MVSFQIEALFSRPFNLSAGDYTVPDTKESLGQKRLATIVINIVAVGLLTFVQWSDWKT